MSRQNLSPRVWVAEKIEEKLVPKVGTSLTERGAESLRKDFEKKLKKLKEELSTSRIN